MSAGAGSLWAAVQGVSRRECHSTCRAVEAVGHKGRADGSALVRLPRPPAHHAHTRSNNTHAARHLSQTTPARQPAATSCSPTCARHVTSTLRSQEAPAHLIHRPSHALKGASCEATCGAHMHAFLVVRACNNVKPPQQGECTFKQCPTVIPHTRLCSSPAPAQPTRSASRARCPLHSCHRAEMVVQTAVAATGWHAAQHAAGTAPTKAINQ